MRNFVFKMMDFAGVAAEAKAAKAAAARQRTTAKKKELASLSC